MAGFFLCTTSVWRVPYATAAIAVPRSYQGVVVRSPDGWKLYTLWLESTT